jgi:hypothetical protein
MPKVSEFFGIQITFNYRGEHNPPHFHAWHAGCEGVFAINLCPISMVIFPRGLLRWLWSGLCCMEMS